MEIRETLFKDCLSKQTSRYWRGGGGRGRKAGGWLRWRLLFFGSQYEEGERKKDKVTAPFNRQGSLTASTKIRPIHSHASANWRRGREERNTIPNKASGNLDSGNRFSLFLSKRDFSEEKRVTLRSTLGSPWSQWHNLSKARPVGEGSISTRSDFASTID